MRYEHGDEATFHLCNIVIGPRFGVMQDQALHSNEQRLIGRKIVSKLVSLLARVHFTDRRVTE